MKPPLLSKNDVRAIYCLLPFLLLGLNGLIVVFLRNQWRSSGDPIWYQLSRLTYAGCVSIIGLVLVIAPWKYFRAFDWRRANPEDASKVAEFPKLAGVVIVFVVGILALLHGADQFAKWQVVPP